MGIVKITHRRGRRSCKETYSSDKATAYRRAYGLPIVTNTKPSCPKLTPAELRLHLIALGCLPDQVPYSARQSLLAARALTRLHRQSHPRRRPDCSACESIGLLYPKP